MRTGVARWNREMALRRVAVYARWCAGEYVCVCACAAEESEGIWPRRVVVSIGVGDRE